MAIKLQIRRDTALLWTINNPELLPGELGFETDTRRLKIGSTLGTLWNDLDYVTIPLEPHTHNTTDINFFTENVQAEILTFIASSDDIEAYFDDQNDTLSFSLAPIINKTISVEAPWNFSTIRYSIQDISSTSGIASLNLSNDSVFKLTLTEVTEIQLTGTSTKMINWLLFIDNTANFSVTWPSNIKWSKGEIPTLTSGLHIFSFMSIDEGVSWHNIGQILDSK